MTDSPTAPTALPVSNFDPITGTLGSTTPAPVKPGWQTTEFYAMWFAKLLGFAYAAGLIGDSGLISRIAGLAVVVLAYFGYAVSRGLAKSGGALLLLVFLIGTSTLPSTGCAATTSTVKTEVRNVEGCSAADAGAIVVASSKIADDFKASDRVAAAVDIFGQLAIINDAWKRCKAGATGTNPPA